MSTPPLENVTPAPFLSQVRPFLRRVANCVDTPPDNYDSPLMNHPYGINEFTQLENAIKKVTSLIPMKMTVSHPRIILRLIIVLLYLTMKEFQGSRQLSTKIIQSSAGQAVDFIARATKGYITNYLSYRANIRVHHPVDTNEYIPARINTLAVRVGAD